MPDCGCGCGKETRGGTFLPGHDQTLRTALEQRVGGLPSMEKVVTACEEAVGGQISADALVERLRGLLGSGPPIEAGKTARVGRSPVVLDQGLHVEGRPMNDWTSSVRYRPWRGSLYASGISGHRLLVLGESVYEWRDSDGTIHVPGADHATTLVQEALSGAPTEFIRRVQNTFLQSGLGLRSAEDFWSRVAFHEFIQRPLGHGRERKRAADWQAAWPVLVEVISALRPHCVLVLGRTMWKNLPPSQWVDMALTPDPYSIWATGYAFADGLSLPFFGITHPSKDNSFDEGSWGVSVARAMQTLEDWQRVLRKAG